MQADYGPGEEWRVARQGIQLVLNNRYGEAQLLFSGRRDSVQIAAGYCFVVFMNAMMTFEEEMLVDAMAALKDMERRCAQDVGWLRSMKNMFGGVQGKCEADRLEEQIILADSQVCIALLTFLQQDMVGYLHAGWVLRKAWRAYQHTYHQILSLYQRTFGLSPGFEVPSMRILSPRAHSSFYPSPSSDWSVPSTPGGGTTPTTPSNNSYRNPFAALFSYGSAAPQ